MKAFSVNELKAIAEEMVMQQFCGSVCRLPVKLIGKGGI
jgi:hypothetical protein